MKKNSIKFDKNFQIKSLMNFLVNKLKTKLKMAYDLSRQNQLPVFDWAPFS